ncbi:hypothetical protein W97_03771 [Coniosporium apollinis CBS 100218]|uniref:TLC domain-containing protein n=1 Tax=Coniosporium apollinis (strain CBS 100218) TaxID=1168221 RepID=R7YRQ5_CONA1|nr:uncharacterized protein W97_03771 [Coniosporium apollinis CBS 100218]EON64538.1 hypothetical protein W97_03771 [Coniosporium apollinis CBS 100218]
MAARQDSPFDGKENLQNGHANCVYQSQDGFLKYQESLAANGSAHECATKKRKGKGETLMGTLCAWVVEHQIGLSINLVLLLALTHLCFPRARRRTQKFFTLSYHDPSTGQYTQGWDDLSLVSFWIVIFTGLRAAVMDYILKPYARWGGVDKPKARVRFAEQAWLFLYYSIFWTLGMYIMYNSPYWFNLREMWTHFPTRGMSGLLKWYYLVQFAFWLQQIVVVNIEERRKDYAQMFTHHIVTSALMFMSYGFYQTKVGNVILCIMDVVDIILPAAKMLKYLSYSTACDIAFGVFMITWFVARHVFYLLVCWSIHTDVPATMPSGCYSSLTGEKLSSDGGSDVLRHVLQPFRDPGGETCFNENIRWAFLGLLLALQVITLIWFGMIVRVAYKVLKGSSADDSRSDDEGEASEDEIEELEVDHPTSASVQLKYAQPLEEEVGVEELHFARRMSPSTRLYRRSSGRASGISITGHSDRKELLGRIGCDKPS